MSKSAKWLIAFLALTTIVSVSAVVFLMVKSHPDTDDEDEQEAVKIPSHVSVQNGRTVIRLDAAEQAREGIRVSPVSRTSLRTELRATAVVLSAADLATARISYAATRARLDRDRLAVSVARTQYERVKSLYEQNQNMSLKAMQDAEAAWRNAQSVMNADDQDARLQLDPVRARWGVEVAGWIASNNATLQSVLEQRELLAQVVFPPGETANPPQSLSLEGPRKELITARYISAYPQVNPQVQGIGFLYELSNRAGLAVGMNLVAHVPVGRALRGSFLPDSAVVWWQGKAWVYELAARGTFTRVEAATGNPVNGGYFVPGDALPDGTNIVTAGAQALLSEEFRSQIQQES